MVRGVYSAWMGLTGAVRSISVLRFSRCYWERWQWEVTALCRDHK